MQPSLSYSPWMKVKPFIIIKVKVIVYHTDVNKLNLTIQTFHFCTLYFYKTLYQVSMATDFKESISTFDPLIITKTGT